MRRLAPLSSILLALGCQAQELGPLSESQRQKDAGQIDGCDKPEQCDSGCIDGCSCSTSAVLDPAGLCVREADVLVPMRDGIRLQTRVVLPPDGDGPFPVVLLRTPYWGLAGDYGVETFRPLTRDGYAFVYQSVRGTDRSEGVLDPLGQEFDDGEDSAEWIANQSWSNGMIGTIGGSYEGFAAMAAAIRSSHVKVAIPDGFLSHAFGSWPVTHNGVLNSSLLWWLHVVETGEDLRGDLDFLTATTNHHPAAELDTVLLGAPSPLWRELVPLMERDSERWGQWSLDGKLEHFCTPVLLLEAATEWEDDVIDTFVELHDNECEASAKQHQRLVLGAHAHGQAIYTPLASTRSGDLIRRTLETFLKGAEVGLEAVPRVHAYVQGSGRWATGDAWPLHDRSLEFRLFPIDQASNYGGLTADDVVSQGRLSYTFDPAQEDVCAGDGAYLVYVSAPFEESLELLGAAEASLNVSIDAPDTDLFTYLMEVPADGGDWKLITLSALRLRFRESLSAPRLMPPGVPTPVRLEMVSTGYQVPAGSGLALILSSSECGQNENTNTGLSMLLEASPRPVHVEVLSEPSYPSTLRIPVLAVD